MPPAVSLPLSRTCNLGDFPGCLTVADWQQRLAAHAWALWTHANHLRTRDASLVVNYTGVEFLAPGPTAIYQPVVPAKNGERNGEEHSLVPAIFALSVLDKIEAPVGFLHGAAALLPPGGLLFTTFAFWDAEGEDTASGAEERTRIYSATSYTKLIREARRVGFEQFGGVDWRYHGDYLDDHSLASLVLTKRRE